MAEVSLKCSCGTVRGIASNISPKTGTKIVCYCDDCQALARYLGREADVLDDHGGTDIFQITPAQLKITDGSEQFASMRLSSKGLIRWYTDCCKTPIGNTVSAGLPFVGVIHNFMDEDGIRDKILGQVRFYVQGKFAKGTPSVQQVYPGFPFRFILRGAPKLLVAKLRGQNQPSPFFDAAGKPIAEPSIYTPDSK